MKHLSIRLICSTILFLSASGAAYASRPLDPSTVLIVVNDSTPAEPGTGSKSASQYVADHYASARGIPQSNIVHIRTAMACCASDPAAWDSWHISWQQFVADVREPIKSAMEARKLTNKIKYIVTTYGVPSHVYGHPWGVDDLSVDSMLSIMNTLYADSVNIQSPLWDPDPESMPNFRFRVFRGPFYIVARLDGPSAEVAAGLVDKALAAEKGISRRSGTGYFDWRHLPPSSDGYYAVDQTMLSAYNLCVAAGMNCTLNDQSVTGSMIWSAPGTLWAWGWYSGASTNDVYTFVPGAVGAQLTSYTANSIRTMLPGAWVPLWLERGITATWGATGEPYANFYALGDSLLNRLWHGYSFGEAAYLSCPSLGWKIVFVGDPLYSPRFVD